MSLITMQAAKAPAVLSTCKWQTSSILKYIKKYQEKGKELVKRGDDVSDNVGTSLLNLAKNIKRVSDIIQAKIEKINEIVMDGMGCKIAKITFKPSLKDDRDIEDSIRNMNESNERRRKSKNPRYGAGPSGGFWVQFHLHLNKPYTGSWKMPPNRARENLIHILDSDVDISDDRKFIIVDLEHLY